MSLQMDGPVFTAPDTGAGRARFAVHAPERSLARLMAGGPLIIAEHLLPDLTVLQHCGATLCRLQVLPDRAVMRVGPGNDGEDALVRLDHAPTGVLALVARSAGTLHRLLAWWQAAGGRTPMVVIAESGIAALPDLLHGALGEVAAGASRLVAIQGELAALRAEADEGRAATADLLRLLAGRAPSPPETILEVRPEPGRVARLTAGDAPLLIDAGVATAGLASLALHLAEPADADLRVRVLGGESGRVLAAWNLPAAALVPGWFTLETPAPIPGPPQTLFMDLSAVGSGAAVLSRGVVGEEIACRLAVLPPGSRAVQPLHFDWTAWQAAVPAPNGPRRAPQAMIQGLALEGAGVLHETQDDARRLDLPAGWGAARLILGPLPEGVAAVQCDLALSEGVSEAQLTAGPEAGSTGWRTLEAGLPRPFALALPAAAEGLSVHLRGEAACSFTLHRPVLYPRALPAEQPAPPAPRTVNRRPAAVPRPMAPPPTEDAPAPTTALRAQASRFATARLDGCEAGENWAILDLRIEGLVRGADTWPEAKMKFGITGTDLLLEFRRRAEWPRIFETWPGTDSDEYGDKFVLLADAARIEGIEHVAPGRDTALVAAIAEVLVAVVNMIAPAEDQWRFAEAAQRLSSRFADPG